MAFERPYRADENSRANARRPLLPAVVANTLVDTARLVAGTLILFVVAAGWLSLMSWSLDDPSLSHVTALSARNWLGSRGAVISDLLIQTFGLAALAVLMGPMFWGMTLIQREGVPRAARKLGAYLTMVFASATAAASLPAFAWWPLHHGLGGIIGDATLLLVSAPLVAATAEFGRTITGALLAVIALGCAGHSIGLSWNVLSRAAADVATIRIRTRTVKSRTGLANARTRAAPRVEPALPPLPEAAYKTAAFDHARTDSARPALGAPQSPRHQEPHQTYATARAHSQFGPYAAFEPEPDSVDDEFDEWTAAASSGMAARFAPSANNAPHAMQETLLDAFTRPPFLGETDDAPGPDAPYEVLPPDAARAVTGRPPVKAIAYKRPSLNLLERPRTARPQAGFTASMLRGNARLLEDVFAEFGVVGQVSDLKPGPVVTLYEFEPARGTNPGRVIALADDIARGMSVPSVRIAQIPGRGVLAVELPNQVRETIHLRDLFEAEAYRSTMDPLPVALGRTATGEPVIACLTRMPHVLMAGSPGQGTSVGINAMILSLVYKHGPENCRFLMIDPNMVELTVFDGIPHLLTPVVTDPHKAITALAWCVREMEERYKRMAALGVRTIDVFNNRVRNARKRGDRLARTVQTGYDTTGQARFEKEEMSLEPMPYIVIVIEEFAGLMAVAGREIEGSVKRLAEAARAAGIHLIMATERPASDIVTGALKESLPSRFACKVASRLESRAVLGAEGAEQLLGDGDMLYATGGGQPVRVHGAYVSAEEVETVAGSLREQGETSYVAGLAGDPSTNRVTERRIAVTQPATSRTASIARHAASEDALYDRAVAIVVRDGRASSVHLQRRLNIQPSWADALLARLVAEGVIAAPDAHGHQAVLVGAAA